MLIRPLLLLAVASFLLGAPDTPRAGAGKKKPLTFEVLSYALLLDNEAAEAGFHSDGSEECMVAATSLKLSNGDSAGVHSAYFKTAEEANLYFDWTLKRNKGRVTERTNNTSTSGMVIGKRAWIAQESGTWELTWTAGSTFRSIWASTRDDVLMLVGVNEGAAKPKSSK